MHYYEFNRSTLNTMSRLYKHFKGNIYEVICKARNSETLEDVIVYQDVNNGHVWVRPASMFYETVDTPTYKGLRFTPVE